MQNVTKTLPYLECAAHRHNILAQPMPPLSPCYAYTVINHDDNMN